MLCKNCEFMVKERYPVIQSLDGRRYHCRKYGLGVTLKKKEDIETLECVKGDD